MQAVNLVRVTRYPGQSRKYLLEIKRCPYRSWGEQRARGLVPAVMRPPEQAMTSASVAPLPVASQAIHRHLPSNTGAYLHAHLGDTSPLTLATLPCHPPCPLDAHALDATPAGVRVHAHAHAHAHRNGQHETDASCQG